MVTAKHQSELKKLLKHSLIIKMFSIKKANDIFIRFLLFLISYYKLSLKSSSAGSIAGIPFIHFLASSLACVQSTDNRPL